MKKRRRKNEKNKLSLVAASKAFLARKTPAAGNVCVVGWPAD